MAWDSTRPVPWRRMINEWLVYVAIMFVVILLFFRNGSMVGIVAGLLVSGPVYLAFGFVLAKFGYQRKTLRELRSASRADDRAADEGRPSTAAASPRAKPAPTSRTGGGTGRPGGKRKRR